MSREIGIPWSDPMVIALLAKRKTVTRRKINPQPGEGDAAAWAQTVSDAKHPKKSIRDVANATLAAVIRKGWKPRYRVGDHIWGREAWGVAYTDTGWVNGFTLNYRADGEQVPFLPSKHSMPDTIGKIKTLHEKWRPPMFMPRWASRLLHRVLDVRAERLLDITDDDARAEGLERRGPNWFWPGGVEGFGSPRTCYLRGYDTLHGKGASDLNPWVWRIAFEPVEA